MHAYKYPEHRTPYLAGKHRSRSLATFSTQLKPITGIDRRTRAIESVVCLDVQNQAVNFKRHPLRMLPVLPVAQLPALLLDRLLGPLLTKPLKLLQGPPWAVLRSWAAALVAAPPAASH